MARDPRSHVATEKVRLDLLLVNRGLAASRERARALILARAVFVDGSVSAKAGTLVDRDAEIRLAQPDHPFVGRGGLKLAHALEAFGVAVEGKTALDIGASTGGFTDVLLRQGARRVFALDVGYGQLDWRLRQDERVVVIERTNARTLRPDMLPCPIDIVTIDVSFISLTLILPVVPALLTPAAHVIALVKPQFEATRREVGQGGIVRDEAVRTRALEKVQACATAVGLKPLTVLESPVRGAEGNIEFLLHMQ